MALLVNNISIPLIKFDVTWGTMNGLLHSFYSSLLFCYLLFNCPFPTEWSWSPHLQMMWFGGLELMQSDVSPHHRSGAQAGPLFPRTGLFLFAVAHADNLQGCSGGLSQGLGSRGVGK